MLLKRNLLETVIIISCSGTLLCIFLNYVTNISPITGVWFHIYILALFLVSVTCSFRLIQWLLHLNKPLHYDLEGLVKNYPYLSFLLDILPRVPKEVVSECKEYDTNDLSVISTVLERRLVSSWYVPYVSQEIGFPFACKQLLDQMIGKAFQICNKIETKEVYVDICTILITHLKEYRKAVKRHEKYPDNSIESLYKKSHPISNSDKNNQSAEHCTNLLRIILKDLVPWELWDTPHSELLVRILSKKLDHFIDNTLADPVWLNDKLMTMLKSKDNTTDTTKEATEKKVEETVQEEIKPDIIEQVESPKEIEVPKIEPLAKIETNTIESALSTLVAQTTAPILQHAVEEVENKGEVVETVEEVTVGTEPVDIKTSPVLRQRRGRQGRHEVKIYDRIIEGSVKTWETDTDLQCISLGQDLLASLNGEITLSRLWGLDPPDTDPAKETRFWFGDEEALDMELDESPGKKESSPTPADLLKELQTTVHQAKTKIGDLQVPPTVLPVNDEAAGMMEGLLDRSMAGLRKGLRLTGLRDDLEKSPLHKYKGPEKSPPPDSKNRTEQRETGISSIMQKDDNGSSAPPLLKQQRVTSQDSVASLPKPPPRAAPPPPPPPPDSPEPQYEEAADLSASIAKLRSLLKQRDSDSPPREEVWWEGAEETRGRAALAHCARPVDSASLADEYDMSAERNPSPQSSNNMQRLDKLFQRTVTGVFNSLKTAVGAEQAARATRDWVYAPSSVELSVGCAVARLVGSRRAFSHVDAALDSLEQLPAPRRAPLLAPDDCEEWVAQAGAAWGGALCAGGAAGLARTHLAHRLATLLLADLAESLISAYLSEVTSWLRRQIFRAFEQADLRARPQGPLRELDVEETCAAVVDRFPVLQVFGEDTVKEAVGLSVRSFTHRSVNKDVTCRLLDLLAGHFKRAAALRNPSFDNN